MSFNQSKNSAPAAVTITRCRNGFIMQTPVNYRNGDCVLIEDFYVFNCMGDLNSFLVEHDFEVVDE